MWSTNLEQSQLYIIALSTVIIGLFGNRLYAANAPSVLTVKLSKERSFEYSICAIFFNSSLMVSIMARFNNNNNNLSETFIMTPFMFLQLSNKFCILSTKSLSNKFLLIWPLNINKLTVIYTLNQLMVINIRWVIHKVKLFVFHIKNVMKFETQELTLLLFITYFNIILLKMLQKSSVIKNISITLSLIIIALLFAFLCILTL